MKGEDSGHGRQSGNSESRKRSGNGAGATRRQGLGVCHTYHDQSQRHVSRHGVTNIVDQVWPSFPWASSFSFFLLIMSILLYCFFALFAIFALFVHKKRPKVMVTSDGIFSSNAKLCRPKEYNGDCQVCDKTPEEGESLKRCSVCKNRYYCVRVSAFPHRLSERKGVKRVVRLTSRP